SPITVGEWSGYELIGAEQTSSGYEVARKNTLTGDYQILFADNSGNVSSYSEVISASGVEAYEPSFYQDLNGDGVIGTSSSTVIAATGNVQVTLSPLAQAATIAAGATLELTGADSGSVMFNGTTGTLTLDHSSTFTGQVFNFSGT